MIKDLPEGRGHARPDHGGGQPGGLQLEPTLCARPPPTRTVLSTGFMGMGMANAVGGINPQGLYGQGGSAPQSQYPVAAGGGFAAPTPETRCRGSAGCGSCSRRRCVDVFLPAPPTPASSAATAAAPSPQAMAVGIASAASTTPARSAATAARSARKAAYARRPAVPRSASGVGVGPAGS